VWLNTVDDAVLAAIGAPVASAVSTAAEIA
jgi:hypothetical protein